MPIDICKPLPRWGALAALLLPLPALAADDSGWHRGDFNLRLGAAGVMFGESGRVSVAGSPVAGSNITLTDNTTLAGEIEYFPTAHLSVAVNFGIPPQTTVGGAGTLAPLGQLGKVSYGIGAAMLRYHLFAHSRISPFAGVGVGHFFPTATHDGAVTGLRVGTATNVALQGGLDVHVNRHLGVYADVSYAPLKTTATGFILGFPALADVTLNPTIVQGGIAYRF
ncbi:MAG TPA: OmpW family outer membrane protein [Novosphingobium sp.]|nr:OmpW family outer membrane protein [Novosphingobium sp.]